MGKATKSHAMDTDSLPFRFLSRSLISGFQRKLHTAFDSCRTLAIIISRWIFDGFDVLVSRALRGFILSIRDRLQLQLLHTTGLTLIHPISSFRLDHCHHHWYLHHVRKNEALTSCYCPYPADRVVYWPMLGLVG